MKAFFYHLFGVLLAAFALVACEESDSETTIDFSALTHEELLLTEGGLEYLVSQGESYSVDALNKRLETETLSCSNFGTFWGYRQGCWMYCPVFGASRVIDESIYSKCGSEYTLIDEHTLRNCFNIITGHDGFRPTYEKFYVDLPVQGSAIETLLANELVNGKVLAYTDDYVIYEMDYEEYGKVGVPFGFESVRVCRIGYFRDNRNEVLSEHMNQWQE